MAYFNGSQTFTMIKGGGVAAEEKTVTLYNDLPADTKGCVVYISAYLPKVKRFIENIQLCNVVPPDGKTIDWGAEDLENHFIVYTGPGSTEKSIEYAHGPIKWKLTYTDFSHSKIGSSIETTHPKFYIGDRISGVSRFMLSCWYAAAGKRNSTPVTYHLGSSSEDISPEVAIRGGNYNYENPADKDYAVLYDQPHVIDIDSFETTGIDSYGKDAQTKTLVEFIRPTGDVHFVKLNYMTCISEHSKVIMADRSIRELGQVHEGDYVLGYSWKGQKFKPSKVIYSTADDEGWDRGLFNVKKKTYRYFSNGITIEQAHKHEFFNVEHNRFMYMKDWKIGEHTLDYRGNLIEYLGFKDIEEPMRYAKITLEEKGTNFFANGILTGDRNCPKEIDSEKLRKQITEMSL